VPGCGESLEAAWLFGRYPGAVAHFLDKDPEVVATSGALLGRLGWSSARAVTADLTRADAWPPDPPDLVLFIHPYVVDQRDYVATRAAVAPAARALFGHLWSRLPAGARLVVATLEELEVLAIQDLLLRLDPGFPHTRRDPRERRQPPASATRTRSRRRP
jgi:hypothetical protein